MGNSFGKISLITANLPCRTDLGQVWCMFNMVCEKGKEAAHLAEFHQTLEDFAQGEGRMIYLAENPETDIVETLSGEEEVSIFTCFLTVGPLTVDKIRALNAALVDLFGTAPDDPQVVLGELAGL